MTSQPLLIDDEPAAAVVTPGFESSPESDAFFAASAVGQNIFLTGQAGTGKSHLLREWMGRRAALGAPVEITASTGIAALTIGGMTLHRWSGMMLGPRDGQSNAAYYAEQRNDSRMSVRRGHNRIRSARVLVIDEISMLPGKVLSYFDFLCRKVRETDAPFGGLQIIATGDFLQLPPVARGNDDHDWAFKSDSWLAAEFVVVELRKIHRQVGDPQFAQALAAFRIGAVGHGPALSLRSCVRNFPPPDLTRLFTHNTMVDRWNGSRLEALPGDAQTFEADFSGPEHQQQALARDVLSPVELVLKLGARVMVTVNDAQSRWVNGDTGHVRGFGEDESNGAPVVEVELDRGETVAIPRFKWSTDFRDESAASMTQFPLRLAYAMTIHKAQGLTLAGAYVDARAAREPGQAYVALSRVRTKAGLWLKEWPKGVYVSQAARDFYAGYRSGHTKDAAAPVIGTAGITTCNY